MNENAERPWFKHWPEGVPRHLDYPDKGIGEIFDETARKYPNNTAVIFLDTKVTYKQLLPWVDSFATALAEMGVKKGDVVGLRLPNSIHYVIAYFAAMKIGAVITANNPLYKAAEIEHRVLQKKVPFGLVPHVQARLLARHLRGDLEDYPPFIYR